MKVLIFGTRTFKDYALMKSKLDLFTQNLKTVEVVTGCNGTQGIVAGKWVKTGADILATQWAFERLYPYKIFHADWDKHGKSAGPIRNQEMVDYIQPDGCAIAFWDGVSTGTKDTITRVRDAGLVLKIVRY